MEERILIITNDCYELGINYDAYLEYCDEMDSKPEGEFDWWEAYERDTCMNEMYDELAYSELNNRKLLITGYCGLGDGKKEIVPVKVDGIQNVFRSLFYPGNTTTAYLMSDGTIRVRQAHHDGTNEFCITLLEDEDAYDKAYDAWDNGESDDIEVKEEWLGKITREMLCA